MLVSRRSLTFLSSSFSATCDPPFYAYISILSCHYSVCIFSSSTFVYLMRSSRRHVFSAHNVFLLSLPSAILFHSMRYGNIRFFFKHDVFIVVFPHLRLVICNLLFTTPSPYATPFQPYITIIDVCLFLL